MNVVYVGTYIYNFKHNLRTITNLQKHNKRRKLQEF